MMENGSTLSPSLRAVWDREMDAMAEKYRFYANESEETDKLSTGFDIDPVDDETREAILKGTGRTTKPGVAVDLKASRAASELVSIAQLQQATQEWNDEGGGYEPTREELDWLAVQELFKRRESALCALVRNRAADEIEAERWKSSLEARQQLNEDSVWIAQMLHAGGEKGFKPAHAPRAAILDLLTGMVLDLPHTVGKNFIPCEAAKKRSKMLIAAEHWCERHRFDRFWVMHGPGRVLCEELRSTFTLIHRRISKLNAEPFMKSAGVRLNLRISEVGGLTFQRLRSTEEKIEEIIAKSKDGRQLVRLFGRKGERWVDAGDVETVEHRDGLGRWTFYPHVNVLAHFSKGKIDSTPHKRADGTEGASDWQVFLSRVHAFWDWGWRECGGLDDIREAIKYAAKPADLRRMSAPEVCALAKSVHRLHLAQPLGLLKDEIRSRRSHCVKLSRWRNHRTNRLEIREKPDWNAQKRTRLKTEAEIQRERDRRRLREKMRKAALNALLEQGREQGTHEQQAEFRINGVVQTVLTIPQPANVSTPTLQRPTPPPAGPKPLMQNRVVARMVGTSFAVPRVGPQLLVWGFQGATDGEYRASLKSIRELPFVAPLLAAAGIQPDAIKVHTSPVTVRSLAFDTAEAWSRPPDPGEN